MKRTPGAGMNDLFWGAYTNVGGTGVPVKSTDKASLHKRQGRPAKQRREPKECINEGFHYRRSISAERRRSEKDIAQVVFEKRVFHIDQWIGEMLKSGFRTGSVGVLG